MLNKLLLLIFVILQVLDIYTTYQVLKNPGYKEGNKVMKWIMDRTMVIAALLFTKYAVVLAIIYFTLFIYIDWWTYALIALNALYILAVWNNSKRL